jgi:hypothetical protein
MTDDGLVDKAAENNLALVSRLADRELIHASVVKCYKEFTRF